MLTINFKQIYETNEKVDKEWVLIIYDISANHYVGMPVYSKEKDGCIYCNSINKYVDVNKIADYNRSKMNRCIYVHGKPLKLTKKDFNLILQEGKNSLLEFLNKNIKSNIDGISYIKWCRDKYIINKKDIKESKLIQNANVITDDKMSNVIENALNYELHNFDLGEKLLKITYKKLSNETQNKKFLYGNVSPLYLQEPFISLPKSIMGGVKN